MSETQIPAASRISAAVDNRLVRVVLIVLALAAATVAAVILEDSFGLADASPVFLVAVVLAAGLLGTTAAVVTSVASFLTYDFLFTTPRFTFAVSDPAEWLSLLLFLLVAFVIGRLTALLSERVEMAERRARESVALVAISGEVAIASSFTEAAQRIVERLCLDTEMRAMWITLEEDPETIIALAGPPPKAGPPPWTLVRTDVDGTSDWLRLREAPSETPATEPAAAASSSTVAGDRYVVAIEGGDGPVGWIGAARDEGDPRPGRGARRLLVLAADQLAIAYRRDELQADLTEAEVARQSDRLRAAILDSVSHDLRTPIASIRALAGGLEDAAVDADPAAVRTAAAAIDREGARLGELVNGLLDMGRIQAGAVKPSLEPFDLAELVDASLQRDRAAGTANGTPRLVAEVGEDLPPVLVDEVLFQAALGNVVDNALQHAAGASVVRIRGSAPKAGRVCLDIDDDGPGVPADALPHLFDRFYRVAPAAEPARQGLGMGLAITRGFVEAMGGSIEAEASDLGGLRIRITLSAAGGEAGA